MASVSSIGHLPLGRLTFGSPCLAVGPVPQVVINGTPVMLRAEGRGVAIRSRGKPNGLEHAQPFEDEPDYNTSNDRDHKLHKRIVFYFTLRDSAHRREDACGRRRCYQKPLR